MLASFMDGQVMLVDRRIPPNGNEGIRGVGRLSPGNKAPPWCMSVSPTTSSPYMAEKEDLAEVYRPVGLGMEIKY